MARVALVSGASSGLGRSLALELAGRGWDVAIGARRVNDLAAVAAAVEARGVRAFAQGLDLRSETSIEEFVAGAAETLGPIQLLVNNAGVAIPGAFAEQSVEELRTVFETNLVGTLLLTRAVVGSWGEPDEPRTIVFVSSSQATETTPHLLPYGASKRALEYVADGLRSELRDRQARVLTVRLGAVETPFRSDFDMERAVAMVKFWQQAGMASPNRGGDRMPPERVAAAIADCLADPFSPFVELLDLRN
ncbi:MAG: SDR family NAD(P)-dependent oxidoreductase [Deltaproteobacteria bacterium]|nr:SDR family NAD(P)-dependent oxidoreductase [Deltaproteobacteria bacterium]MBW2495829.1 SDR family NAD(P)-dependent oxidoreductase [Deltaproteobacteria bacterium]